MGIDIPVTTDSAVSLFTQTEWKGVSSSQRCMALGKGPIVVLHDDAVPHPNPHPDFGMWDLKKIHLHANVFENRDIQGILSDVRFDSTILHDSM